MIYSINSNKRQFRKVEFKQGFNVVLATRTEQSSDKDSRNGLGKSTLIDIVHFLLGKNLTERLPKQRLEDWVFSMTFDLGSDRVTVSRGLKDTKKVIVEGLLQQLPETLEKYRTQIGYEVTPSQWSKTLGYFQFGLDLENDQTYSPSYASLINYFSRRNGTRGGYSDPFKHSNKQQPFDVKINNSFLLGLGWEFSRKYHLLKDRGKVLQQIRREAHSGLLSNILGVISQLDSERIRLEEKAKNEENGLRNYKPLQQYDQFVRESNELTGEIHQSLNNRKEFEFLLQAYEKNLTEEEDVEPSLVARLYEEARVEIPTPVIRRLEEVKEFNKKIIKNRKEFLKNEINRIKEEIRRLSIQIEEKTNKRAEFNGLIRSHKSQDEYEELIRLHQRTLGELENTKNRILNMKKFEEGKRELDKDVEVLVKDANLDLMERETQRKSAILKYNEYSQYLYEVKGDLNIGFTEKGLELNVNIERSGSSGIDNMKIFCYDMVLADIWSRKNISPGFLMHDSVMFDPVDERQKAKALQLAWLESEKDTYQYICMLNSDDVPYNEFEKNFDFDRYVALELTDASPEGSLLGFRF